MARGTSAEERASATTVELLSGAAPLDEDVEQSFEDWRASFDKSDEPGRIAAYQIPLDERGNLNLQTKTQIRLGAWAIDLYTFEELCAKIINEWMIPAGDKIMAVRFIGSKTGERGIRFNKVVMLRPAPQPRVDPAQAESTSALLKAFQEMNERTVAMLQQMRPATSPPDPTAELSRMLGIAKMMNEPMNQLLALLVPALIGRQSGGGNGFEGLGAVLEGAAKIAELARGNGSGDGNGDDSLASILRAVQPMVKPALEAIPHIMARVPTLPSAAPALPNPTPNVPTPMPTPPPAAQVGDIPSGDMAMFAQLKPQVDSLVQMAAQGSDPIGAADMLFDGVIMELDDDTYSKVADMLSRPAVVNQVAILNPEAAKYRDFFEKFRAQIAKRVMDEESAAGTEPTAQPGTLP